MQNIIFYFLLDCECSTQLHAPPPARPPRPAPPTCTVLAPRCQEFGERRLREGPPARCGRESTYSPAASRETGGLVQTILREGKARLRCYFWGNYCFPFFFKSLLEFCWRILCDLFHKKKKKKRKSYNWKNTVVWSGSFQGPGVGWVSGCGSRRGRVEGGLRAPAVPGPGSAVPPREGPVATGGCLNWVHLMEKKRKVPPPLHQPRFPEVRRQRSLVATILQPRRRRRPPIRAGGSHGRAHYPPP